MKKIPGTFAIIWVDGTDSKGLPIKYQSLVEVPEPKQPDEPPPKCYHDWEAYEGLWFKDRKCLKCGLIEVL
jgi:hypothetical protein